MSSSATKTKKYKGYKLKCYFAHPSTMKGTEDEQRILNILKERNLEVINPFEEERELQNQYDFKTWQSTIPRKIARQLWVQDIGFIDKIDLLVAWFPCYEAIGTAAEVQHAIDLQRWFFIFSKNIKEYKDKYRNKIYLIQIISKIRHPLFAYALMFGNQLFDTIDDFERLQISKWE